MKNLLFAGTAALALPLTLAACGANEVEYAEVNEPRTEVLSATAAPAAYGDAMLDDMTGLELKPVATFKLTEFLNADVIGAEGDVFTDVEDVYVDGGMIRGISFDADAAFGGKRYAEFASLAVVEEDDLIDDDLSVVIPRTEDSFDDFDLIDENVELTFGDTGTDLLEADVMVAGYDDEGEIEEIWFNADGSVAYYEVDMGILDAPMKVEPYKVTFADLGGLTTVTDNTEVLDAVEYGDDDDIDLDDDMDVDDDADDYDYVSTDYMPDRK